jgi:hypothetical protein
MITGEPAHQGRGAAAGEQFCQATRFTAALKCEGWQRERTGLVPEMLFLAAALNI